MLVAIKILRFVSVIFNVDFWPPLFHILQGCSVLNSLQLKAGGAIPAKGKKVTLLVRNVEDLSRDVIKVCLCFSCCLLMETSYTLLVWPYLLAYVQNNLPHLFCLYNCMGKFHYVHDAEYVKLIIEFALQLAS